MKIIHCADIHLDSSLEGLSSKKSQTRKAEIVSSFIRLCEYAKSEQVTAVIIAGDFFDYKKTTKRTLEQVGYAIKNAYPVEFLYLIGNHDQNSMAVEYFKDIENFKVFSKGYSTFKYDNVVIAGLDMDSNSSNSYYDLIRLDDDNFNVLVMHGQIADYKGNEKSDLVSLPYLRNKNIDYLALGHYHSYQQGRLDDRGIYAYSGCLDGRGFDELGDKGFIVIDTEKKDFISFVKFSSRIYQTIDINVSEYDNFVQVENEVFRILEYGFNKKAHWEKPF